MSTAPGLAAAVLTLVAAACARAGVAGRRRAAAAARLAGDLEPLGPPARRWLAPRPPAWLARRLEEAGIGVPPAMAWAWWTRAVAVAVATAGLAAGPAAAALPAAALAAAPVVAWRLVRHRGQARFDAALPAVVEAVAAGLRSGASLRQALAEAAVATPGPLGDDLTRVAVATERGAGVVTALEAWAGRRPSGGVRLVVAALCLGAETGGARASAVDGVATTLRQRLAAEAEARALGTQARASAAVIAAAPVAFCALAFLTDPRSATFLLQTPTGVLLLSVGLALDAAGALWMARLTRIPA